MERNHERSIDIAPNASDPNSLIIERGGEKIGYISLPQEAVLDPQDEIAKVTLLAPDRFISLTQSDLETILETIKSETEAKKATKQRNSFI